MSFSQRKSHTRFRQGWSQEPDDRSPKPKAHSPKPKSSAYTSALVMLSRRELSEAQIRHRLELKGHEAAEIESAVDRLKQERAINDERVAEAIAHTAISVHRRGKLRVRRQIEQAGISRATAHRVTDAAFGDEDPDVLLEAALARRLRHNQRIVDRAHLQRLYRYLVGQGFESDRVLALLNRHYRSARGDE